MEGEAGCEGEEEEKGGHMEKEDKREDNIDMDQEEMEGRAAEGEAEMEEEMTERRGIKDTGRERERRKEV